jgi:hypothetical protein
LRGLVAPADRSRAREALARASGARQTPEPMAGSPLKRQRKLGVRADHGSVISFPRMPRVADLPRGWRYLSTANKIKHLLGMSLDRALEIVSWPLAECDPPRLSLQVQVIRIVVTIAGKALLDGSLDREVVASVSVTGLWRGWCGSYLLAAKRRS